MKPTNIVKINPIAEIIAPILLQCKDGECGQCPSNTGKFLWIPGQASSYSLTLNFKYNFFDASVASTSAIKYNLATGTINGSTVSYSNRPDKAWSVANQALSPGTTLSPSLMSGNSSLSNSFTIPTSGGWMFFRQPNPAISNVHDALCFEYNNEKKLVIFRSF